MYYMSKIQITKNAWNKMGDIIMKSKNKIGFIYSASSGGCNGFNFELNLLEDELHQKIVKQKFYTVLSGDSVDLYVDPLSEMYLLGTTIDYIHEDYTKGIFESKFNFEIDKGSMTSCGCCISFSPKV